MTLLDQIIDKLFHGIGHFSGGQNRGTQSDQKRLFQRVFFRRRRGGVFSGSFGTVHGFACTFFRLDQTLSPTSEKNFIPIHKHSITCIKKKRKNLAGIDFNDKLTFGKSSLYFTNKMDVFLTPRGFQLSCHLKWKLKNHQKSSEWIPSKRGENRPSETKIKDCPSPSDNTNTPLSTSCAMGR